MSGFARSLTLGVSVLAVLAVAGCSSGSDASSGEVEHPRSALASLDPCSILTPEQATAAGLPSQGEFEEQISSEPGCTYPGESMRITIFRNAETSLDEYEVKKDWEQFNPIDVNERPAAEAIAPGAVEDGMCTTMLSATGGVVLVDSQSRDPREPFDACGESLKIAKQIEPSLPE